ncbi:MAG: hypothetical protein AAFZ52_00935, partial [Bacteroidota bacterium]
MQYVALLVFFALLPTQVFGQCDEFDLFKYYLTEECDQNLFADRVRNWCDDRYEVVYQLANKKIDEDLFGINQEFE